MGVEVHQPVEIEPRGAAPDTVEVEPGDRLVAADDFVVAMAPAQAQQAVHHRIGQDSQLAIGLHAERAVPLRQLGAVGAVDQRDMGIDRRLPAEGAEELGLAERVVQMVVAADRMGDAHLVVVDHDGEHVGRRAVAPEQHHVVELAVGNPDGPLYRVLDRRLPLARRLEADRRVYAGRRVAGVAVAPASVVEHRPAFGLGPLAHFGELLRCGITAIGFAFVEQAVRRLDVVREARVLAYRLIVPVETEPGEAVIDRRHGLFGGTAAVGVFDPQQKPSAVTPREQPVEQRRPRAAYMEEPGRGGGEAGDDRHGGSSANRPLRGAATGRRRASALTR